MLQQDVTLLRHEAITLPKAHSGHTRTVRDLLQEARIMRASVSRIAKKKVMPEEVEALHNDVTTLQIEVSEIKARLDTVEGRDQR